MEKRIRSASRERISKETRISLDLSVDGSGQNKISTGFGMLDHMLDLISFWARMDLNLRCQGDLHIDAHHTVEDTGLVFGSAFAEALGDRTGIARSGFGHVPMDEAMADVTVDISGRPWLVWRGDDLLPAQIAHEEKDIWREFYKSFATAARLNLHICFLYGKNGHHLLESAAKGLGLALRGAVRQEVVLLPSTKGILD